MNKKSNKTIGFRQDFGPGDLERVVAENDDLLAQYYVDEDRYVGRALNRDDNASVFIGPKGVGKSAILQMVRLGQRATGDHDRVIEITPDDLAFNALVNINARTPLLKSARENQWLFKSLWDYVLCVEILRRESTPTTGIEALIRKLFGSSHQREQDRLQSITLTDDGQPSSMTDKMLDLVKAIELQGSYGEVSVKGRIEMDQESGSQSHDLKLLQLINNVARQIDKTISHEYFILIDDLDLNWQGTDLQNSFLGAMFQSI